ncbi:hypothetical protein [Xanthomonas theicola]|uniref:Uncharacterized protein n=1 Tax=Xanthomonas theicola TaxID=56464 RepID=A0A2S6ZBY2_9XANT|nr:hypothetical protein [Xanthomonas theicola]PPT83802.1 hypothetical protein XthCFBP4691_16765 [Xanthomonas theicola]QNH25167.1 hypothetical protein G4Q83_11065 [Xanthomonas theicola]
MLPYATLLMARRPQGSVLGAVDAFYEWQGAPLLFLVAEDALQDAQHLHQIRRLLAMRGDAPYLGVVAPGRLDVYRIALDRHSPQQAMMDMGDHAPVTTLARLGNGRPEVASGRRG